MIESQVRALFTAIASSEPDASQVDTQLAHRRGRARLRWRRAGVAGAPLVAAVAVAAVVLAVGAAAPPRPSGPASSGPSAPRQFSPLTPYLSFGWLPAGISPVQGGMSKHLVWLTAARKLDAPYDWELSVYTAGTCHLSGSTARELNCTAPEDNTIRLTGRAPSLRGHRAFWAGTWDTPSLAWQYARNGWAEMALPFYPNNSAKQAAARRDAIKIASQIRYGAATPPLLFPIQLTHLPSRWRVSSVTYVPDAGVLRASSYALGAGPPNLGADGGLVYETGLPYFDVNPPSFYGNPPCYRGERGSKIINGYQVVVTNVIKEQLCAPRARGLIVVISEFGAQPAISVNSLFGRHLRLLGPNPANWTSKPIG
jgi:hypothetical protein